MKMKCLKICIIIIFGCNTIISYTQDYMNYNNSYNDKYFNCWDNYLYNYIKIYYENNLNIFDIISNINQLFIQRKQLLDEDEINFWDLCVVEAIKQNVDCNIIIENMHVIMRERKAFIFVNYEEKNLWDLVVYELIKVNFNEYVINIATEVIYARRQLID